MGVEEPPSEKRKASNNVGEASTETVPERFDVTTTNIKGSGEVIVEAAQDQVSHAPPRGFY